MKIALAHDYLNQFGGGERVLAALSEIFPSAEIYTLFYDKKGTKGVFEGKKVHTGFLDAEVVYKRHRAFIPLMPMAAKRIKIPADIDLVISDSAGFSKGFSVAKGTRHISYMHTPLRYAWETEKYFKSKFVKKFFAPAFSYLRRFDFESAQKSGLLLANSGFIAEKIRNYYGREARVVYPPIDEKVFYFDPSVKKRDYFLCAGRLLPYKRFDLIVEAFNNLNFPLKVVGEGRERKRLEKIANKNIEFLGFRDESQLRELYCSARGFVFASEEDFGLVMAEAIACGTPVVALKAGGAMEIVSEGENGVFFEEQTASALAFAVERVAKTTFSPQAVSKTASRFSKSIFKRKIEEGVRDIFAS